MENNETKKSTQAFSIAAAVVFALTAMYLGYRNIGLAPVVIVGGASLIGMVIWMRSYLKRPLDPRIILPPFLLTVAALEAHMAEEYLTGFGPAMSRVFDVSWSEHSFLMVFAFIGPVIYTLTALGLYYRVPLAGFIAWFIFIGPGLAEFTHFIFPLIKPAILPESLEAVSQTVSNGNFVANMPNYWLHATGRYYFSGMYTAILPMIPGVWAIVRTRRATRTASLGGRAGLGVAPRSATPLEC
jgi:hypothetical protein